MTNDAIPTAMPATASPWPAWPVFLIWLRATKPSTIPMIEPIPHNRPIADAASDPMASGLVPVGAAP